MKNTFNFFILLFLVIVQFSYAQPSDQFIHRKLNEDELPDSSIKRPDYRNRINIPEYDPSLMPLKTVRSGTGVWTELNPKVPRVDYLGIHFINKDTGWACGANGALIKTTDGGNSWLNINTQITTPILKVRSYNGQIVIASGYNGLILRSTDGGETFTQVASGVTGDLWGLQIINDTLGWACGNRNSLRRTTDAGLTWQQVLTPGYTSDYWWVDFLPAPSGNESHGFIAANGKVLRTTDGGSNWEIIQAGDSYPLFCLDAIDSLHIAAAGYGGTGSSAKNLYSSDGGSTWINGGQLTTEVANCIQYLNPDTGYVILSEVGLWKTTNRGMNWRLIDSASFTGIGEFEIQLLTNENIGFNAGTVIKLYKSVGNFDKWERLVINDNFYDVHFINETTGFAISGAFYKTTDGGSNWNRNLNAPGGYDILFVDNLTGFVVNNNSTIYKTTNGGLSWYLTNVPGAIGDVRKIFFINKTIGWAATIWSPTSNAKILKTIDGGENWFVQLEDLIDPFTSIYFIDSLNGWATSRYIWQTTNGGTNWIQRTDIPIIFSDNVYFSNYSSGWVARRSSINPSLYKSTDAGLYWTVIPEVLGAREFCLFPDTNHFIITGSITTSYIVYKTYQTYDGGNTWIDISNDVPTGFSGFSAVTDFLAYAVGGGGLILRYDDTTYIPVELISFEGSLFDDKILLTWITASELNNKGFCIERSFDKISWISIGFVPGHGTKTDFSFYNFLEQYISSSEIFYRLKQADYDGRFTYSKIISVSLDNKILAFELFQNYPNPFNPKTNISYSIPKTDFVNISLYSILGDKITELINEEKQPGFYTTTLDASNLASGIYLYKMITGRGYASIKKITIIK